MYITLILSRPMEFAIKFDAFNSGWPIVYIEGLWVIITKQIH